MPFFEEKLHLELLERKKWNRKTEFSTFHFKFVQIWLNFKWHVHSSIKTFRWLKNVSEASIQSKSLFHGWECKLQIQMDYYLDRNNWADYKRNKRFVDIKISDVLLLISFENNVYQDIKTIYWAGVFCRKRLWYI